MRSAIQVLLIRFAASPVAFLAALLLAPLAGLVLFQSLSGTLLIVLPLVLYAAGALLLRRAHPALMETLRQDMVARGLARSESDDRAEHFTLDQPGEPLRIFLAGRLWGKLTLWVLVPKDSWLALTRLEGTAFPPRSWNPLEFNISEQSCLEVYLREITHVETGPGGLILHTTGNARIEIPDCRNDAGRASDYLRTRLRSLDS